MPRLDWQMWFLPLSPGRNREWFGTLLERLQTGSPDVLSLLSDNPFPDEPPRYLRASAWDYRFTTFDERSETGDWWKREFVRWVYRPQMAPSDRNRPDGRSG